MSHYTFILLFVALITITCSLPIIRNKIINENSRLSESELYSMFDVSFTDVSIYYLLYIYAKVKIDVIHIFLLPTQKKKKRIRTSGIFFSPKNFFLASRIFFFFFF